MVESRGKKVEICPMAIWHDNYTVEQITANSGKKMLEYLDIRFEEIGDDYLLGSMPVDHRTQQPFGIFHGGASCVLAESIGSVAANLVVDPKTHYCLGLDINANHLKAVRSGRVYAKATPVHIGRSTQVWQIILTDESERKIAISRLTMAVMQH